MKATASSFADPDDVEAFKRCKAQGKTDKQCFAVGDNGIGCWGDSTVDGTGPSCAIHLSLIKSKWGSKAAGKHKWILVRYGKREVKCVLKDICGVKDRIDLNPDAVKAIGLTPPILVPVHWDWIT